jgi:hypothetical protein
MQYINTLNVGTFIEFIHPAWTKEMCLSQYEIIGNLL